MTDQTQATNLAQLNNHPLNRAAAMVLAKADPDSLPPGILPVLALAISQLEDANPSDDRLEVLSQWAASPEAQSRALARLEKVLEPDDLLRANNPLAAAEAVANELQPHQ